MTALRSGEVVDGRFEIVELTAEGGMSEVHRAHDHATDTDVAIKVIKSWNHIDRLWREARILAGLHHPRIVDYVAHGTTPDGLPYLAMEWLEGETVQERIVRSPLSIDESVAMIADVADALSVAHRNGVVHRDLKPSNLFLVGRDCARVKVLDFGIALLPTAPALTRTGAIVGTPGYMAPEQARADVACDERADVFSLGCVLFECITGRAAFRGEHMVAVLAKILVEEVPRCRGFRPETPQPLDDLVARMLVKDRKERPDDLAAIAAELHALRGSERTTTAGPLPGRAISDTEQRFVCVVMARDDAAPHEPTSDPLRSILSALGLEPEWMRDGSALVTLTGGSAYDLASRGARCALRVRRALPGARVAVATGRAVLDERALVGQAIDRAAALLQGSSHGVFVDTLAADHLQTRFVLEARAGAHLLSAERAEEQTARTVLGRATPFVGRDRELSLLRDLHAECVSESVARAVIVTAPAGMGKSRLRAELVRALVASSSPPRVMVARGSPMSEGPLGLIAQIVRQSAAITDDEPEQVRREKLRTRVEAHVAATEVVRVAEFLGELAGTPFDDHESAELRAARRDARLMSDQLRHAWETFVAAEVSASPLLLVIEDLHWGDPSSVAFLDATLRLLSQKPLMVLALARPEVHDRFPQLWSRRDVIEVKLLPLSRKASARLVTQVLGADVDPERLDQLASGAQGNPFLLEELVRAAGAGEKGTLPDGVFAAMQARLEKLPTMARRVLRAGSVFGGRFWRGAVSELVRETSDVMSATLDLLVDEEFITRAAVSRFAGDEECAFLHALLRDVAYDMLPESERVASHAMAAEWLRRAGETSNLLLAEHYEKGAIGDLAAEHYLRAAREALQAVDLEAALAAVARGLVCDAAGMHTASFHLVAAQAHDWKPDQARVLEAARAAMRAATRGSTEWYEAALYSARPLIDLAMMAEFDALTADVLDAPTSAGAGTLRDRCIVRLAQRLLLFGDRERAAALWTHVTDLAPHDATSELAREIDYAEAIFALFRGQQWAFLSRTRRLQASHAAIGDVRESVKAELNVANALIHLGRYHDATETLREMIPRAERLGLTLWHAVGMHLLGVARGRLGAFDEARTLLRAGREATGMSSRPAASADRYLAEIAIVTGDYDEAVRLARGIIETCTAQTIVAEVRAVLAEALLAQGHSSEALAEARIAFAAVEAGRVEEEEARIRLVYARTLDAVGERDAARSVLGLARDRLRARAGEIDDETVRASFCNDVEENAATLALAHEWGLGDT